MVYMIVSPKYYQSNDNTSSTHTLLKDASVLESDYGWVRTLVTSYSRILNIQVSQYRPLLALFSLFSKSHSDYKNELDAIECLSEQNRLKIQNNTCVYGGETEEEYASFVNSFESWRHKHLSPHTEPTKIFWYTKSDSLNAAREFQKSVKTFHHIAITSFANSVRVGGQIVLGGKAARKNICSEPPI
jgi:hypothetical protein